MGNKYSNLENHLFAAIPLVFFLAIVAIIVYSICVNANALREGEIFFKEHQPARVWYSTTVAPPVGLMRTRHYDDEDWIIHLRRWNYEKGGWDKGKFYVTKAMYDTIQVGAYMSFDSTCMKLFDTGG